ncbi:MAG TPA: hypothetical protein PLW81_11970 [Thiobacillaceae bacterium]|nr:hypothetical protein [Thiobacillaceae bacterium]
MQTLPAQEVKRRGLAAIEELLPQGPVHILKHNRPACVVLSEAEYARLNARSSAPAATSAWDALLATPGHGEETREQVDQRLAEERDRWE